LLLELLGSKNIKPNTINSFSTFLSSTLLPCVGLGTPPNFSQVGKTPLTSCVGVRGLGKILTLFNVTLVLQIGCRSIDGGGVLLGHLLGVNAQKTTHRKAFWYVI